MSPPALRASLGRMGLYFSHIDTPFGATAATVDEDGALVEFTFLNGVMANLWSHEGEAQHDPSRLETVARQVHEFFDRKRVDFDLVLRPRGTAFRQKVWRALGEIPFGATFSYEQLALKVGDTRATRAVGSANGKNPIALIIPCHRVIGKNGSLTGYGGGLPLKRALLDFETPRLL